MTGANQCSTGMPPVTVTLSGSLLSTGCAAVPSVSLAVDEGLGGGQHVAAVAAGAVLGHRDGRGVGPDLQAGALGVERADVDGDGREAEHRDEQEGEDHRGGAALAVEPAPQGTGQPLHRMTPVPVRSKPVPKKPVREGIG